MPRVLVIDNYDSFTWNLVQAFWMLGASVDVVRHDELPVRALIERDPDLLVISPGPGRPDDAGISCEAIQAFAGKVPILGVCLGHQCLAAVFGGQVGPAAEPRHGKTSSIWHHSTGLFEGLQQPLEVMRYHSLLVKQLPREFELTAWTTEQEIMAMAHRQLPIVGVQFHPESILTPQGPAMLASFLALADAPSH